MKRIDQIYDTLKELEKKADNGVSAYDICDVIDADRSNVSRYLNLLVEEGKVDKIGGRPVLFKTKAFTEKKESDSFSSLIGSGLSLMIPVQQAKAAIYYPPRGLHTLLLGETGVGKSMFAEKMYQFAKEVKMIPEKAPFIHFNCADYASNPQLLVAQIFGVKKGAFTGADQNKDGLLLKADRGILFLDEVHRLSPEGQEMLFTFIDKKVFRPLGETEATLSADVQIIAATTEDPGSYLLKTFTRRIPMTIFLPPLSERLLEERYQLIQVFINQESKRVNKSIYINKQSLISFLLYECSNNIGQLKSDIQLACAKAFLNYKSQEESYILISQMDLPHHVKRGMMKIKEYRDDIDNLLKHKGDILRFYYDESPEYDVSQEDETYFYNMIDEKVSALKASGMGEDEINQLLNIDIESYFKKYIGNLKLDELKGIVDETIIDVVEKVLDFAGKRLNRIYDERILFGLSLHLHSSIERIRSGKRIFNPKLNLIRVQYDQEFIIAMEIAKIIDKTFEIEVPLDEIGYLTMFLASESDQFNKSSNNGVYVLVVTHGMSTATSMVQVAKSLVSAENVLGLDMSLSMKAEDMYEIVKSEVIKLKAYDGIMLLVDMGSLLNFGDMIYEETGVMIKVIDMVSTPVVLEACRKADLGRDINEIFNSCREMQQRNRRKRKKKLHQKSLILTACFTGEGAAEKLKKVLQEKIPYLEHVRVESINILNRKEYLQKIEDYQKEYRLLAIVGTIDIDISGVTFVSAVDIFSGSGLDRIEKIVLEEDSYYKIVQSLKEHITITNIDKLMGLLRNFLFDVELELQIKIAHDVKTGIVLHMSFLVEKLLKEKPATPFDNLEAFKEKYTREFIQIRTCLNAMEDFYQIQINDDEVAYLCKMLIENTSVQ
ncbi:PRD domain-containing protein [Acidaminobacter sp. JC074]|uniref:sigma 54-interacting transcriptional regulator n=1 Tax=Acidaminobacter sp. JC074 TaxID=2530199 RepID=UPI001F10F8DA|nr:sigma-54-dependent transcriptional regulator [Acidaminobacter sp. JC074]MCH4887243.1 PRD domain-containing protein [Acidaminobacter sp. JC074]